MVYNIMTLFIDWKVIGLGSGIGLNFTPGFRVYVMVSLRTYVSVW